MSRTATERARRRNRASKLGAVAFARIENHGTLEVGDGLRIANVPIRTHIVVDHGAALRIGRNLRMGHGCGVYCGGESTIGDNVIMQAFVSVIDSDFHVAGNLSERPPPRSIHIGDDVTLGYWSVVLAGADIGRGAVVAAGSVVSGRVADGAHVFGNPARPKANGAPHDTAWPASNVEADVIRLVTLLFDHPVTPSTSRDEITAWDSLGSVRLIGSVEDAFPHLVVPEKRLLAAVTIQDVIDAIASAKGAER